MRYINLYLHYIYKVKPSVRCQVAATHDRMLVNVCCECGFFLSVNFALYFHIWFCSLYLSLMEAM